jgi:RNA polymerase sigma-19 factor, ECF subfamily
MMDVAITEKLLWTDIIAGDHRSFHRLFDRYWESLFQYAYKILQNREDAEETVQELFIHIWQKRAELPSVLNSVPAYLFTALKNRLLNHLAKRKHRLTSLDQLNNEASPLSANEHHERKNMDGMIRSLAGLLPEKMQQAYLLHQFKGLSVSEIAAVTGNSEQTIRNQINTAIKKISHSYLSHSMILLFLFFLFLF